MRRKRSSLFRLSCLLGSVAIAAQGCAAIPQVQRERVPQAQTKVLTPTAAILASGSLDGATVSVRGWVVSEAEDRGLWADLSAHDHPELNHGTQCLSLIIPPSLAENVKNKNRRMATLKGVLYSDFRSAAVPLAFGLCNKSVLLVTGSE